MRKWNLPISKNCFNDDNGNETENFENMWLVKKTEYYSGRDIRNLYKETVWIMLRDMNSDLKGGEEDEVDPQWKIREITKEDFEKAFKHFKPTTTKELENEYIEWFRKFGAG